jgi:hypothetical protein
VGLIGGGELEFDASTTIAGSSIVDLNSTATRGLYFNPGTASNVVNFITNSTFTNVGGVSSLSLVFVTPSTGSGCQNLFSHDTFVASNSTGSGPILFRYYNLGNVTVSASSDRMENCTFFANQGSNVAAFFSNEATTTGLTLKGNTFSSPDGGVVAIWLDNIGDQKTQLTNVLDNTIHLPGANTVGIIVSGGQTSGAFVAAEIINNQISTTSANGGIGLVINAGTNPNTSVDAQA